MTTTIIAAMKNEPKVEQFAKTVNQVAQARGRQVVVRSMLEEKISDVAHDSTADLARASLTKVHSLRDRCSKPGIYVAESWDLFIPALGDNQIGRSLKHRSKPVKAQEGERILLETMRPFRDMNERCACIRSVLSYWDQATGETGSYRGETWGYILKSPDHGWFHDIGLKSSDSFFARLFLPEFIPGHPETRALHHMPEKMRDFGPRAKAFQDFAEAMC